MYILTAIGRNVVTASSANPATLVGKQSCSPRPTCFPCSTWHQSIIGNHGNIHRQPPIPALSLFLCPMSSARHLGRPLVP